MPKRNMSWLIAGLVAVGTAGCGAGRAEAPTRGHQLFAQTWNSGRHEQEPPYQVQAIDENTFAIRQSIQSTSEAPFIYLLIGKSSALLIDTGDPGGDLRAVVEGLIGERLSATWRREVKLVVMHTHGHGDHVGGDEQFAQRNNTTVVGHSAQDVAEFFGIEHWPTQAGKIDLGGRIVDIVPAPGHHPSHVVVHDRATRILFTGDALYPGILRFPCGKASEYLASIERLTEYAAINRVRWLLGGHIEMKIDPAQYYLSDDRVRQDEHLLELRASILLDVREALNRMVDHPRVESFDHFVLFPHPANPQGLQPPDWCNTN